APFRPMLRVWGALVLSIGASGCGLFKTAKDVVVDDPVAAVEAARRLIAAPHELHALVDVRDLPRSLQLRGLRWAYIGEDHLDLILMAHPDGRLGARIWAATH